MPVQTAAPRKFSPTTLAYIAVGVVVVVVVALVIVKVTGGSNGSSTSSITPQNTAAPASVVSKVTGVNDSVSNAVGAPAASSNFALPPVDKGQPPLTYSGKPGALYIGGEFCPYCAAMRWSIIMAFGRFGTFSNLKETISSPWDTDGSTPTFSFLGAGYTSSYVTFKPIENESNDTGPGGQGRHVITPLTSAQNSLWGKYDSHFGVSQGFPFLDIGNKVFLVGPTYDPTILGGGALTQNDIANKLSNSKDPITQAIVGTANYLTAGICSTTGMQPTSVCSQPYVTQALKALGIS